MGKKPELEFTDAVVIGLNTEREDPYRLVPDDGTIAAFRDHLYEQGIYPLAGFGASGPGIYNAIFEAKHRQVIVDRLTELGYDFSESDE